MSVKINSYLKTIHNIICSLLWLWEKNNTLQCTYLKTNMVAMNILRVGIIEIQDKQNANKNRVFGYGGLGCH